MLVKDCLAATIEILIHCCGETKQRRMEWSERQWVLHGSIVRASQRRCEAAGSCPIRSVAADFSFSFSCLLKLVSVDAFKYTMNVSL